MWRFHGRECQREKERKRPCRFGFCTDLYYELEKLKLASMNQAHGFSLEDLKQDELFDQIEPDNLQEITEGIIKRLQRESQERQRKINEMRVSIKSVKTRCLSELGRIAEALVHNASSKQNYSYIGCTDTTSYLAALQKDTQAHYCQGQGFSKAVCYGLSGVSSYLSSIKQQLEQFLPSWHDNGVECKIYGLTDNIVRADICLYFVFWL